VGQYQFKKVEHFKYMGTIVTQKNVCQIKIQLKIKMGNKCFYALDKLLSSIVFSKEVKIQLYLTIIRSMVHNVGLFKKQRKRDYMYLREKCYAKYMDLYMTNICKDRGKEHNQQLMVIFKRPNVVNEIKRSKLE